MIWIYLLIVLFVVITPVYCYLKSFPKTFVVFLTICLFFVVNIHFLQGNWNTFHDLIFPKNIFLVIKQWIDYGISIGWNPYMNGGEPLYLFSNFFLHPGWIIFSWIDKVLDINNVTLFKIYWVFMFLNFCIISFLLFLYLFDNFFVAIFSLVALMFSNIFIINSGQPIGIFTLYYLSYILLSYFIFLRERDIKGLLFFILFLSMSMNRYIPHYLITTVMITVAFTILFNLKMLPIILRTIFNNYRRVLLTITISLFLLSPALFIFYQMKDYVSPVRGGNLFRTEAIQKDIAAPGIALNVSLGDYRILWERKLPGDRAIHSAFYFGIVPLLLIPFILFYRERYKEIMVFVFVVLFLIFMGLGKKFVGYNLLVKLPTFNVIRQSFCFSQHVSFSLIILSGYGFLYLYRRIVYTRLREKILALALVSFTSFTLYYLISHTTYYSTSYRVALAFPIIALAVIISIVFIGKRFVLQRIATAMLVGVLLIDLVPGYIKDMSKPNRDNTIRPRPVSYPLIRKFSLPVSLYLPPDIMPLILKISSVTNKDDSFVFFRNRYFDEMLKRYRERYKDGKREESALGVNTPIFYFTSDAEFVSMSDSSDAVIDKVFDDAERYLTTGKRKVILYKEDFTGSLPIKDYGTDFPQPKIYVNPDINNPNKLELKTISDYDGFLVRLENFHPSWKVYIDGKRTKLYRANYVFSAVMVPKGIHKLVFEFKSIYPFLMYLYVWGSVLVWVIFCLFLYRKRQPQV